MRRRPLPYPLLNFALRGGGIKVVFPTPPVGTQADLLGWWDASKIIQADNTPLKNWLDQSGRGNTLSGGGVIYRSSLVAGMPVANFSGTQFLTGNQGIYSPIQVIFIAYSRRTGTNGTFFSSTTGAKQLQRNLATWPNENNPNIPLTININTRNILRLDYNYTSDIYSVALNKVIVGNSTVINDQNLIGQVLVGNRGGDIEYLQGNIHEIIVYNRTMATLEMNAVEDYLAQKWGFMTLNSEFSDDIANWSAYVNGGTGTVPTLAFDLSQGGEIRIDPQGTFVKSGINSSASIQFEAGKTYRLYWDARSINNCTMDIYIGNPNNNSGGGFAVTSTKTTFFFEFTTALAGAGKIYLRSGDSVATNPTLWLDNIYLRKIN